MFLGKVSRKYNLPNPFETRKLGKTIRRSAPSLAAPRKRPEKRFEIIPFSPGLPGPDP